MEEKWKIVENSWNITSIVSGDKTICQLRIEEEDCVSPEIETELTLEQEQNAKLLRASKELHDMLKYLSENDYIATLSNVKNVKKLLKEISL